MTYKKFNVGDVLTAADVQNLMNQGVIHVANEAELNAIASPFAGMMAYTADKKIRWQHNGVKWLQHTTPWVQVGSTGALVTFRSPWTHLTSSGWNGVWYRLQSGLLIINGAAARGSAGAADEVVIDVAADYRPPAFQLQGTNCNFKQNALYADGRNAATSFAICWGY